MCLDLGLARCMQRASFKCSAAPGWRELPGSGPRAAPIAGHLRARRRRSHARPPALGHARKLIEDVDQLCYIELNLIQNYHQVQESH